VKHTIASLLLVGVVALAFGAGITTPTASQDIHHEYKYDDGIADPANATSFSSPGAPGEVDRVGYGVTYTIGSMDCTHWEEVNEVSAYICPPPASYDGRADIYVDGVYKGGLDFAIMMGTWWHTIDFTSLNIWTYAGQKVTAVISVTGGYPGNVWIQRDHADDAPANTQWFVKYKSDPNLDKYVSQHQFWGDRRHDLVAGDLMIRLYTCVKDVAVTELCTCADEYHVGDMMVITARLQTLVSDFAHYSCHVKLTFNKPGLPAVPDMVIDFVPDYNQLVAWGPFIIPEAWRGLNVTIKVQIVTDAHEFDLSNDAMSKTIHVSSTSFDVGCPAITSPKGMVLQGYPVTPAALVQNFGNTPVTFPTEFTIMDEFGNELYTDVVTVTNLPVGATQTVTFATWTPTQAGEYVGRNVTMLVGDYNASNNGANTDFSASPVVSDVGVTHITSPAHTVNRGDGVALSVLVENFGNVPKSFPVKCDLVHNGQTYHYGTSVENLAPGASQEVTLGERRYRSTGEWQMRAWTALEGDVNGANDLAQSSFDVTGRQGWYVSYSIPGTKPVSNGACMTSDGAANFWLLKGVKDVSIYGYAEDMDQPAVAGNAAQGIGIGTRMAYLNGLLYLLEGNKTLGFYSLDPANGVWTKLADLPGTKTVKKGASMAVVNGMVYVLKGNSTNEAYRYDPATGGWEVLPNIPSVSGRGVKDGAALVGDGNRLFALHGTKSGEFYTFDAAGMSWQRLADLPVKAKAGAQLACLDGVVYAVNGGKAFFAYDMLNNAWTALEDVPRSPDNKKVAAGSAMTAVDGAVLLVKSKKTGYIMAYAPESYVNSERREAEGVMAAASGLKPMLSVSSPARTVAHISYTAPNKGLASIQLYNSSGVLVRTLSAGRSVELNVAGLANGTYLVKAGSLTGQFVVQH
jgi:N-acetylneuraminic acid mutarotase